MEVHASWKPVAGTRLTASWRPFTSLSKTPQRSWRRRLKHSQPGGPAGPWSLCSQDSQSVLFCFPIFTLGSHGALWTVLKACPHGCGKRLSSVSSVSRFVVVTSDSLTAGTAELLDIVLLPFRPEPGPPSAQRDPRFYAACDQYPAPVCGQQPRDSPRNYTQR